MRTALALLCFLCLSPAFAQKYHPMLGDSNKWYTRVYINNLPQDSIVDYAWIRYTIVHYTRGDAIINNLNYKKIYVADSFTFLSGGINGFAGYIREDTSTQKVYFLGKDSASELLLYDFSLEQDDSFKMQFSAPQAKPPVAWCTNDYFVAHKVSRLDGRKYLIFEPTGQCSHGHLDATWLERTGSLIGPLYIYPPYNLIVYHDSEFIFSTEYKITVHCAYYNDYLIHPMDQQTDPWCYLPPFKQREGDNIEELKNERTILSCHIMNNDLVLTFQDKLPAISSLRLTDMSGRVTELPIPQNNTNAGSTITLPIGATLSPGLYIVSLQTRDQHLLTGKVLKN